MSDELKFGFPLCDYCYLLARVKRDGEIKHHYDFGEYNVFGLLLNFYTQFKFQKDFAAKWLRFGIGYKNDNIETNTRIEKDYGGEYNLSNRFFFSKGPFDFRCCSIFDLEGMVLNRYDALINYKYKDLDATIQHISPKSGNL